MPWYALTSGSVTAITMMKRAVAQVRREELLAVDHPLVAVAAPPRYVNLVGSDPPCGSVIE